MAKHNPVCPYCKVSFLPSPRNHNRQKYCNRTSECRAESHRQSQRKWSKKPENLDYFRGPEHVERVRQWRASHPGYWRRRGALHDDCPENSVDNQPVTPDFVPNRLPQPPALHDSFLMQPSVLIGLISLFTGYTLHDDIVSIVRRMQELGNDVLHFPRGGCHAQTNPLSRTTAPYSTPLQLDRPPPGE